MKKQISLLSLCLLSISTFSQSGPKWATGGNGISAGDFIGTTNNFPMDFRINGTSRMMLGTDGNLILNNLAGTGNRMLMSDATGKLFSLPAGGPGQFLQSDGTWSSLPGGATSWQLVGSDLIATNTGNVGVGTSNPQYKLDVSGSMRVASNLLVGGGIVTAQQVDATTMINAGDVNVTNNLNVAGVPTIGNALFFGGQGSNKNIAYIPPVNNNPPGWQFGGPFGGTEVFPDMICYPGNSVGPNAFYQYASLIQIFNSINNVHPLGTTVFNIGATTSEAFLNSKYAPLTINRECGQNLYVLASQTGFGTQTIASGQRYHFSNGNTLFDDANSYAPSGSRVTIKSGEQDGLLIQSNHLVDDKFNTKIVVNRDNSKAIGVHDTQINPNGDESFVVFGNGKTRIGVGPFLDAAKMLVVAGDVCVGANEGYNGFEILAGNKVPTRRGISTTADPTGDLNFFVNSFQSGQGGQGASAFRFKNGILNGNLAPNATAALDVMSINNQGQLKVTGYMLQNSGAPVLTLENSNNAPNNKDFLNVYGNGYTEIKIYNPLTMPVIGSNPRVFTIRDMANNRDLFAVNATGKTYAREVEITLVPTFPDYVFSKEYDLKSIDEVSEYIKENKHLPGFEKGEYYERNGINVNNMLVKQQEKMEEMMLYIIELEKRLKLVEGKK